MLTKQQLKINLLSTSVFTSQQKNPQTINYERTKQELIEQLLPFKQPCFNIHSQSQKVNSLLSFFKKKATEQVRHNKLALNHISPQIEYGQAQSKIYIDNRASKQQQVRPQQKIHLNEYFMKNNKKEVYSPVPIIEKENLEETALHIQNTINLCINAAKTESPLDFRAVSKIQDELKFKREIQEQKQRKKQLILAQSINKRQRTEKLSIFNGCAAKVFSSPQNTTNYETKEIIEVNESKDISEVQDFSQKQDKFNFFDFLKGKITNLSKKDNQKSKKQTYNQKIQQFEGIYVNNNKVETIQSKIPQDNQSIASMKPELSQSDSSSFFKEKQKIEQKGILNVDLRDIVGSSIKQVQANLEKIQENKRKIYSQKQKENEKTIKIDVQQSNQSITKTLQLPQNKSTRKNASEIKEMEQSKIKKIFGKSKILSEEKIIQKKEIPENNSELKLITEFFTTQELKPNKIQNISQPSTVQKNQERSIQFSDVFNQLNFEQAKDSEITGNIFQKNEEGKNNKYDEINLQKVLSQLHEQKQLENQISQNKLSEKSQSLSISKNQTVIKNQRQININLMDLPSISLSFDAFSFSKLSSLTERQELNQPTLNSFKAASNAKQPIKQIEVKLEQEKIEQNKQKIINPQQQQQKQQSSQATKRGKVQKIEINLDSDSSDEDASKQQDQESELDLDDIKDYDSDEDEQKNNYKHNLNAKQNANLTPIIQEDLEESQLFKRHTNVKKISQQSQGIQPRQSDKFQDLKNMQNSLPNKDFIKISKTKSQEISIQKPDKIQQIQNKPKIIKLVKPQLRKVSLIKSLSQPENSSISNVSMISEKDISKTEKQLIESIKEDIEGLKQKISSIIIPESDKSTSKILNKSNLHSDVKQISIDLDFSTQNFKKQGSNQSQTNNLIKLMKERSMQKNSANNLDKKISENQTKQNINFDQLDASVQESLYKQFKQNFMSLKKRVEEDHKNF